MEPLTWTGSLSGLNYIFYFVVGLLFLSIVVSTLASLVPSSGSRAVSADGTLAADKGASGF
ncbi:hypothetical protein ACFQDZ_02645 [Sulfitobacter pacificus]